MKNALKSAGLVAILIFCCSIGARASSIELLDTFTGPGGFDATWNMLQNPVILGSTAFSFDAQVTNLVIDGAHVSNDSIDFFAVPPLLQGLFDDNLNFFGAIAVIPIFSGGISSPTMNTGTFSLIGFNDLADLGSYTLTVTPVSTPEPSLLLLLGLAFVVGAAGVALNRKRLVTAAN